MQDRVCPYAFRHVLKNGCQNSDSSEQVVPEPDSHQFEVDRVPVVRGQDSSEP